MTVFHLCNAKAKYLYAVLLQFPAFADPDHALTFFSNE
jgi:hypothetical protein